jgi:hypothetical protein
VDPLAALEAQSEGDAGDFSIFGEAALAGPDGRSMPSSPREFSSPVVCAMRSPVAAKIRSPLRSI